MCIRTPFDPAFHAGLPLPLARLYALAYRARTERERHDRALHLAEASVKLFAAAVIGRYRSLGIRSEPVDAALEKLVMPALGHWSKVARETLFFLGNGHDARSWAGRALAFSRAPFSGSEPCRALEILARLAGCAKDVEKDPLEFLSTLPAYRNAMSSAHGGIKADRERYGQGAWALLELVKGVHAGGGWLAGARLALAEEVLFDSSGGIKMMTLDLSGPSAVRRFELEDGDVRNGILPGRLYLETPSGDRVPIHPFLVYRSAGVFDEILFLNRAREGAHGIQFLCYTTGELHTPATELESAVVALDVIAFLEWIRAPAAEERGSRLIPFPGLPYPVLANPAAGRVEEGPAA
jgi:hypothetical protein